MKNEGCLQFANPFSGYTLSDFGLSPHTRTPRIEHLERDPSGNLGKTLIPS
ncbi:hypothetical protein MTR_8g028095 [Medicago truncatula]|uniref:Uncharacterized protein n=1 Tax=Medicago truncatula TaxID=3880 RepID=A0A072TYV5_MEDTR|nr:hypothetical protein MTR_8g028095 [Medicago truncatula]